jgi:hypothetical protein
MKSKGDARSGVTGIRQKTESRVLEQKRRRNSVDVRQQYIMLGVPLPL